jgi:hypothetical protein
MTASEQGKVKSKSNRRSFTAFRMTAEEKWEDTYRKPEGQRRKMEKSKAPRASTAHGAPREKPGASIALQSLSD